MVKSKATENTSQTSPILLLEVGTEEIPARFFPDTLNRLKENFEKIFSEYRIAARSIKTYATPRRISLIAEVNTMQEAAEKEIWGPPVNAAFDKDGNPTKAAEAFAKTHNIDINGLIKKEKGKGSYIVAVVKEKAQHTEGLMPEILPRLVTSISFPKAMRWGNGDFRFARPIHWILATYDNKKIPFDIDGTRSINMTRGHRFLSPAAFEIKDNRTYMNLLKNNFVVLDPEERKKIILEGAKKLAASVNASMVEDAELIQHVAFLVEYPGPVLCTFPEEYLSLPKELLVTVMKGHQKYFAVEDKEGKLANYFIVISNTTQNNAETVRKGAEKVIKARFEDARFYFEEDKKITLKERAEQLKKVIYHERLGTLYDKTMRISSLADFMAAQSSREKKKDISTAAAISKADLVSGIVREFPELQGIIGSYYALHDGYSDKIAKALSEQYLPGHSGDRLPETETGAILSLSDKLDNVASFFMLGLSPTGSEDPFALRRQAIGIISILLDRKYEMDISGLLDKALQPFKLKNRASVINDLIRFFEQRIEFLLQTYGYPSDSISAVMSFVKNKPLYAVKERVDAIQQFKGEPDYDAFLLAIKRINNIAPKSEVPPVNKELFAQEEETLLYKEVEALAPQIYSLLDADNYYGAIKLLQTLKEPINRFFDKVLIMDKNEEIKQNRLSLVKNIQTLAQEIADFSKLS